jgi:hypothetical protein
MKYKKIYVLMSEETMDTHSQRDLIEAFDTKEEAKAALEGQFFDEIRCLDECPPRHFEEYEVEEQEELTFTIRSKQFPELYITCCVEDVMMRVK